MAVVSISRIQIRRGRKNAGSGLPQLASGELGWAVDTQELYIGNGSVAEGAPYIGNTKLLSEHDNLFEFAANYTYNSVTGYVQTGSTIGNPVQRSLQSRLDDRVSVRSFGAMGDGSDQTAALQRAIDQLYLNSANKGTAQSRVELIIEPGEYIISNTLYIPSYATLRGAGKEKTIIKKLTPGPAFVTVNDLSEPGVPGNTAMSSYENQAKNIRISGITVEATTAIAFELISCRNSEFSDINVKGTYELVDAPNSSIPAIRLSGFSSAVNCKSNAFDNVSVYNYSHAIVSDQDITDNVWSNCEFNTLHVGAVFGENTTQGVPGQITGPSNNKFVNCTFDTVLTHAIKISTGKDNISESNKFYNVGNDGGNPYNNLHAILQFNASANYSVNDFFERTEQLSNNPVFLINTPYTAEVEGPQITNIPQSFKLPIGQSNTPIRLFKLPAKNGSRGYVIEYLYQSNQVNAMRNGTINIAANPITGQFNLSDEYDYAGDQEFLDKVQFTMQFNDENNDGTIDTIAVMVLNSIFNDEADFIYTIKYKS